MATWQDLERIAAELKLRPNAATAAAYSSDLARDPVAVHDRGSRRPGKVVGVDQHGCFDVVPDGGGEPCWSYLRNLWPA